MSAGRYYPDAWERAARALSRAVNQCACGGCISTVASDVTAILVALEMPDRRKEVRVEARNRYRTGRDGVGIGKQQDAFAHGAEWATQYFLANYAGLVDDLGPREDCQKEAVR